MEKPLSLKEDPDGLGGGVDEDKAAEQQGPDGTITASANAKDDCSDLTDNHHEAEEQAPKSFPQRVSAVGVCCCFHPFCRFYEKRKHQIGSLSCDRLHRVAALPPVDESHFE